MRAVGRLARRWAAFGHTTTAYAPAQGAHLGLRCGLSAVSGGDGRRGMAKYRQYPFEIPANEITSQGKAVTTNVFVTHNVGSKFIMLNRPEANNALTLDMVREIREAYDQVDTTPAAASVPLPREVSDTATGGTLLLRMPVCGGPISLVCTALSSWPGPVAPFDSSPGVLPNRAVHSCPRAWVRQGHPERAPSAATDHHCPTYFSQAYHEQWTRVVVLFGAGEKSFCSGGDVRALWEAGMYTKASGQPRPPQMEFFQAASLPSLCLAAHAQRGTCSRIAGRRAAAAVRGAVRGAPRAASARAGSRGGGRRTGRVRPEQRDPDHP